MKFKNNGNNIHFLDGGGEMGKLIREKDWSKTNLGLPQNWSQSLRITLSIILNSKFPMFLFWGDELICFYNDAYRPSLGKEGKHPLILGMKAEEAWKETWPIIKPLIDQVFKEGEATWSEDQLIPMYRNGKIEDVYWTFSYSPVFNESAKSVGVFVACTETTEKISIYNKLEESKNQLEFAIEATELGTWDYNPLTDKFTANARLKKWFGLPAHEQIELSHAINGILEADRQKVKDAILKSLNYFSGGNYDIEYSIINPITHKEIIVHAKGRAWFNDEKIAYRFNGTLSDITERATTRKKIKESEQRFQAAIEAVEGILWTNNGKGEMEGQQSGWASLTGQTYEQYQGYGWSKAIHPDDAQPTVDAWTKAVRERKMFIFEHRVKTKEEGYKYFSVRAIPLINPDGSIRQWVGVHSDIQDQKIREEKKDEFISIASHEMKTPLTTIKAYLQMLDLCLDETHEEANLYVKKANQSINRLNELVSELLDVSKIRLGKLNYTITTFNFNDMIESTIENIQLTSPKHTIINTGKVCDEVTGDKDRLQQVVINLLNNAIKYSPGAKEVFIRIEQEKEIIKVSVKDTGIGISKQSLNKIFEKYHRIDEHAVHFQGLGIGLFISYEIIQRHHGKLWAESEPNKGSTFYFTIPLDTNSPQ